jgi:Domain of unknown function (DUF4340)
MKKWIFVLSGLLAAQLVLAMILSLTGEDYGTFRTEEKLLSFNKQAVSGLQIVDNMDSMEIEKQEDKWLLPNSGNFPASQRKVEQLLDTLAALEKGWPVARTRGAAQRFAVDKEQFERKLILVSDDESQTTLYVGSSPGFRKVYVRPGDKDEIFTVDFNIWEANAKTEDWIDTDILALDQSSVQRIEMPGITMQRQDGTLQVMNLDENEQTNVDESSVLIGKLTGLRIQSLLGTEMEPEYRQNEPALEIRMTTEGGEVLDYRFSKPQDASYYVLKRSDLDFYFEVAEYTVNPVREATREKLVQDTIEEVSSEPAGDIPDEKDDDASAAEEQESDTG